LAAFGRRPLVYVAPLSLAGIRNPQQKATFAASLNHLVGAGKYRWRNNEAKCLRGREIDDSLPWQLIWSAAKLHICAGAGG
jgi:hypothetical protein